MITWGGRKYYINKVAGKYFVELTDTFPNEYRYYSSAIDLNGKALKVIKVAKEQTGNCDRALGCLVMEVIKIPVSENYLNSKKRSGLDIKVTGSNGESILSIPAQYIQAVMDYKG